MKHERPAKPDVELDALLTDWRDEGVASAELELPSAMERVLARAPIAREVASLPAPSVDNVVELPRRQRALATVLLLAAAISGLFVGSSTSVLRDEEASSDAADVASFDYGTTLSWTGE
jgi:hypothetical protein